MDAIAVNERKVFPRPYAPFSSSLNSTRVFKHVKRELRYNSDEG